MMQKPYVQTRYSHWLGAIGSIMLAAAPATTLAQIAGDGTLGTQVNGSTIVPCTGVCTINGGTERGVNLYHSFKEFSIPTNGQAWFNNSPQIQNILTRVTGNTLSNIDGLLKANGTANLFLLNPNGIVFGPYARLQIGGSFLATTASSFKFPDGSEFSAINPQAPPLLTVNVTPGLQFGFTAANITNRGNLRAGQDLTLAAGNLDVQGTVQAGRDLTLQAQDTVQIRESAIVPLVVKSGRDLTIQGNQRVDILALNHPQTAIQSGRNLSLISDGVISGDAHFSSGGAFQIRSLSGQLATFTSLYDPIISSTGNVDIAAAYTGASLLIESQGSVRIRGGVTINAADTVSTFVSNDAVLSSQPGLIIRSGQPTLVYGGSNQNNPPAFTSAAIPLGITLDSPVRVQPNAAGGIVKLTADNGGITFYSINASNQNGGNGGRIELSANGDIINTGSFSDPFDFPLALGSFTYSNIRNAGNGGAITLFTTNGNITIGNLDSSAASNFGIIGNGGAISLNAINGSISTGDLKSTSSVWVSFSEGYGGSISLSAANGNISTGNLNSFTQVGNSGYGRNGGAISISTTGGSINTGDLSSFSFSYAPIRGTGADGGAISLYATNGINIGKLDASSTSFLGASGNGGAISLATTGGSIFLTSLLDSSSVSLNGNSGNGGGISLSAQEGSILGNAAAALRSISVSASEERAGSGGNVFIAAKNEVADLEILTLSSYSNSGFVSLNASGDLLVRNTRILTSKQVRLEFSFIFDGVTLEVGKTGQSGNVIVTSPGNITFSDSSIQSDTKGSGSAGNVNISSRGVVSFNKSQVISNTSSTGQAGSITIQADKGIILTTGSDISARTISTGNAGNITLNTPILTVAGDAQISAATIGSGNGGSILVNAPIAVNLLRVQDFSPVLSVETSGTGRAGNIEINTPTLTLSDKARITATATATATNLQGGGSINLNASTMNLAGTVGVFAETQGQAPAGTLRLNPYNNQPELTITLSPSAKISASTSGSGNGGDLILTAPRSITITGPGQLAVETSNVGNAGNINIRTQQLTLTDGVQLTASTSGRGKAGDIEITAGTVNLNQGAQVSTNTFASGQAGNVSLHVQDAVTLSGNGTGLFASTTVGSTGNGGNIIIDPRVVLIQDGAAIAVDSKGSGTGGNISIQAGRLELRDRGTITAETASTQGGNITLEATDVIVLRRNSLISATAGTAQAGGDGGNITIRAPFIVGVLSENSDIIANAFTGQGGKITITTNAIYGLQFQPQLTPLSDITASSQFGISGTVAINTLNLDPSRGLVALPVNLTDPSQQISQSCTPGDKTASSSFVSTGRGGIPLNPDEPLESRAVVTKWVEWQEGGRMGRWGDGGANQPSTVNRQIYAVPVADRSSPSIQNSTANSPAPIVEAQGWIVKADGTMELVVASPTTNSASVWTASLDCQTAQGR